MLYNYLKTAMRFITRNISFTVINVLGLTAGITAFLLIALYLQDQMGYDHHLPYPDRTYRLVGIQEPQGLDLQHVAITSGPWAPYLNENIPQVEEAFRVMSSRSSIIEYNDQVFREQAIYFSEGGVLKYLGYPLLEGGKADQLLSEPYTAVISKEVAQKVFNNARPIGETFQKGAHTFVVTGVFDNESLKTHLKASVFLSFSTLNVREMYLDHFGNNSLATYLVARPGVKKTEIEELINQKQSELYQETRYEGMMKITFYLQKVPDIFLRSNEIKFHMRTHQGDQGTVHIFSLIAILILAIACINYINLATANSGKRAPEVGLRKVLGAGRKKLAFQFTGESMLITFFAILVSLGVLELILPYYNNLLGTELKIDFINNYLFHTGLFLILLVVGSVSGFYPAIYLSRFQPIEVLKAGSHSGKPQSAALRKVLVVVQFAISSAMILATAVVIHQVHHMKNKDLGYNTENVISVFNRQTQDYDQIRQFKNRLLNLPEVRAAGIASGHNGVAGRQSMITTADSVPVELMVRYGYVDPDFFPTMQMQFLQGRNFSHDYGTDPNQTIILNRAAQNALGWENPLGKRIVNTDNPEYDHYTVIGVIEDYHYYSLRSTIEPAVYIYRPGEMPVINIRYQTSDQTGLMAKIEEEFKAFFPGYYFQAFFMDYILHSQYRAEHNTMRIFIGFALLCILISCLGLFGLTSFMVNHRRKEISIRKVLGGTVMQINKMLLAGFLRWIFLAAFIALPFTWIMMNRWIDNYAYRIQISWVHLVYTLSIITVIATATVLILSTRAALQNPASTIKYE